MEPEDSVISQREQREIERYRGWRARRGLDRRLALPGRIRAALVSALVLGGVALVGWGAYRDRFAAVVGGLALFLASLAVRASTRSAGAPDASA
jgi:hypothetical protein